MLLKGSKTVVVVGGGASGLIAAIFAKRKGAKVIILERMDRVGKKILATGNGRCNLTNQNLTTENYFGTNPKFVYTALNNFGYLETLSFFEELGVSCKLEEGGKVYPVCDQASAVLDVLRDEVERLGIIVKNNCEVKSIVKEKKEFKILALDGNYQKADKVILATGGKASPSLGSNGTGYLLAKELGHKIISPFPALVQLKLNSPYLKSLKGVKFIGKAKLLYGDRLVQEAEGEILFTDYGISGPPILSLSRKAGEGLNLKKEVFLKINLVSWQDSQQLKEYLSQRFKAQAHKTVSFGLVGFLNKRLIPAVLKEAGITDLNKTMSQAGLKERKALEEILQNWRFEVAGLNSWQQAQVSAGGVLVSEVNPKTFSSKKVEGLYLVGELLDIDGACGGYNLQWAWASGAIAGEDAGK